MRHPLSPSTRSLIWQALGRLHQAAADDDLGRILLGLASVTELVGLDLVEPTQPALRDSPPVAEAFRVTVNLERIGVADDGQEVGAETLESELLLETSDEELAFDAWKEVRR
jgi:hypothetical protein